MSEKWKQKLLKTEIDFWESIEDEITYYLTELRICLKNTQEKSSH